MQIMDHNNDDENSTLLMMDAWEGLAPALTTIAKED